MIGMHRQKYLEHNLVTIKVPKHNAYIKLRDKITSAGRKKAREQVRGHWRTVEYGKKVGGCNHAPTMVEDGLGICLRCERMIRWIDPFERGDAALGYNTHDYAVVASQKRAALAK